MVPVLYPSLFQDEVPSQDNMKLGGKNGFLPYKSTAELIQSALNG